MRAAGIVKGGSLVRTVLCTVGTSLINNIRRELGGRQPVDVRVAEQFLRSADPVRACAETNSLFRLLVYPRGHRTERLFFYEDGNGNVRVCELARHGDGSYERLLKHGVWRANYTDFRPWRPGAE